MLIANNKADWPIAVQKEIGKAAWHRENSGKRKGRVRVSLANKEKQDENIVLRKIPSHVAKDR